MPVRPRIDVLIQPFCLRFSLHEDEIVYHVAGSAEMQLDRMERLMGIDPAKQGLFESNLGFLPVSTSVLIRGERTVVVDPGNHHVGFYGTLGLALKRFGLIPAEVDVVIGTHSHHDHLASLGLFAGKELFIGAEEIAYAREVYGEAETNARFARMGLVRKVPTGGELTVMPGVTAISTPGHTPGHLSVLVETGEERAVIAGDTTMTRGEYEERRFSHWYGAEQLAQLNASLDRLRAWQPTLVLPGHDRAFRPRG